MLQDKTKSNDYNAEHKEYYGKNCDKCVNEQSPNDEDILNNPKYKDSKAYKNYKEIEKVVKDMNIQQY